MYFNTLIKDSNLTISFEDFNHSLLKQIFYKYYIKLQKPYIYSIKLIKMIEYLQNTGFISRIEYFVVHIINMKYIILNLKTNPIVKKVEIKNYNQLKISKPILIKIFKNQIGLPINYKKLGLSIQKIYNWYKDKGFIWVYIQFARDKNFNTLCLQIFEGRIVENSFSHKCISRTTINNSLLKKIEKIIEIKLGISKGCLLNIKKMEQGIKYLKEIKLVNNCKYNIIHHSQGLFIKIEYTISKDHSGYFYYKHLIQNLYLNYIQFCQDRRLSKLMFFFNCNHYVEVLKNSIINIIHNKIFHTKYLLLYKYLGFKYYLPYFNNSYKNLIANTEITNKNFQSSYSLFYPSINFSKDFFSHIALNIHHKINLRIARYPLYNIRIGFSTCNEEITLKKGFLSTGMSLLHKHCIDNQFYYTANMFYTSNQYKKKFLNINKYNIDNYINTNHSKIFTKILHTTIKQKLLYYKLRIKYTSLDTIHQLTSGKLFILESTFFTTMQLKKLCKWNENKTSGWNFRIKYSQIFLLPNFITYIIKKNAVVFLSEINLPLNLNIDQGIFQYNHKYINNIFIQSDNKHKIKYALILKYLHTIEYHIMTHKWNFFSYYIFCNYSNKLDKKYISGLGVEFNIPIQAIPTIRFEYMVSTLKQRYYQLRILL